jgi:large subunit ribosomal protein L15
MLNLNNLKPKAGSIQRKKRVGRGTSSGHGKTSCRGNKGQTSRSGGTKGARFEGGQTPLYRRLPKKRGFKNYYFQKKYREIGLNDLKKFKGEIKVEDMIKKGFLAKGEKIKVLGGGEVSAAHTVHAHKFTKSAQQKIEKAGGKIVQC